jgi:hypothetical protein
MSSHLTLRALLEVNRMFVAEQREINAALIATFLGVALGTPVSGLTAITSHNVDRSEAKGAGRS